MIIDLSPVVREFSVPLTRRSFAANTVTDGYVGTPSHTDTTITGYITPVSGRNIQQLPEGCRESSTHVLYTADTVATLNQQTGILADQIYFEGYQHMVTGVALHSQQGGFSVAGLQRLGTVPA